jgi:hypothetical protein
MRRRFVLLVHSVELHIRSKEPVSLRKLVSENFSGAKLGYTHKGMGRTRPNNERPGPF